MATTLPVPIEFQLPAGWQAAPPDEVGAPGAAFVALHPDSRDNSFTANITISGQYREDQAPLNELADGSVGRLRRALGSVEVANRTEVGTAESPGLTQVLNLSTVIKGQQRDLVQCQVYVSMLDVADSSKRAIIELALTSTPNQLQTVVGDFQEFVKTVRPHQQANGSEN